MNDYAKPLEILEYIFVVCLLLLPLGIWKLIEIIIWICGLNWKALFN